MDTRNKDKIPVEYHQSNECGALKAAQAPRPSCLPESCMGRKPAIPHCAEHGRNMALRYWELQRISHSIGGHGRAGQPGIVRRAAIFSNSALSGLDVRG